MDFIFIDSAAVRRGGQVYIERLASSLRRRGRNCTFHMRVRGRKYSIFMFYSRLIAYMCGKRAWMAGTAPAILPVALFSRDPIVLFQSPIEEWSLQSRIWLRIVMMKRRILPVCVSDYVSEELSSRVRRKSIVIYAQIRAGGGRSRSETVSLEGGRNISLALFNARDFSKGYLSSLVLIDEISREVNVEVDVYGKVGWDLIELEEVCSYSLRGYVQDPFCEFSSRKKGSRKAYLAMSHFEGLHMAVVEAGKHGVPSLLSDIPAHRELEGLAGHRLMIGSRPSEYLEMLRRMVEDDSYYQEMVSAYEALSLKFIEKNKQQMLGLMDELKRLEIGVKA